MAPNFGERVTGREAFLNAVRNEQGGAEVFGTRVRGAIPDSPSHGAKRASEFGARVTRHAESSDREGNKTDAVSTDEIRNILAENPTFFDQLYELELARADGPREEALRIFLVHEQGIKGQGRQDILGEINSMLGVATTESQTTAQRQEGIVNTYDAMQKRTQENLQLRDADRLRSLRRRDEDLREVENSDRESTRTQALTTEGQMARSGEQPEQQKAATDEDASAKPKGDVSAATQQPGIKGADSPKSTESQTQTRTSKDGEGDTSADPESMTVAELRDELGEEALAKVRGTGSEGAVIKADLVKAVAKARKAK
jgi:hypothetical protein